MSVRTRSTAVTFIVGCWITSIAAQAGDVKLPDTVAGKRVAAYFEAFNSGDEAKYRSFEEANRAESSLQKRPIDDRLEQYRGLINQWRRLDVRRVADSSEHQLVLIVHAELPDEFLEMGFDLEASPPHKLTGIRIAGNVDPRVATADSVKMNDKLRARVANRVADELAKSYVYPKVGEKMADAIRAKLGSGEYDSVTSAYGFARRLTDDLRAICNDKHLRIRREVPRSRGGGPRRGPRNTGSGNFGFQKVEILPGNVGYIKLNGFAGTPDAEPTAAAAMAFVKDVDALIFDIRENGGGSPRMIAFLSGYLLDERTLLNKFYNRPSDSVTETWSRDDVPGHRFGEALPVYVLTSSRTFSAAEEFTYNLKHMKRATIVGETTGGGAHPVTRYRINKHFSMSVPYARAINPITNTNWEGVGVVPHVATSAPDALDAAHKLAMDAKSADVAAAATGGGRTD